MPYDPTKVHTDVAACLDDISNATKGEEVRGSIYDAIELIDVRTTRLAEEIQDEAREIVEEEAQSYIDASIDNVYLVFECSDISNVATCNKTASEIYQALENNKKILVAVNYGAETRYGGISISPFGNPQTSYAIDVYTIYNGYVETFVFDFLADVQEQITYTYTRTRIGGGGGGSYTDGDGIDITNNEISVKLRSTNPGLAFDNDGSLYATGSGGSDYSVFIYHSSNQLYCNHRFSDIYNEVQTRQYPDFNVIIDYHPSSPGVKYYHGQLTNCNVSAIRFRFDISTETTTHIVEYMLNSNDELSLYNEYIQENQKKLSSTNAGTGISITNDLQGNPVISLDLPQAEGGGF